MALINYNNIQNVIILRIGKIGDLIISSFVFSAIKKFKPDIKIYLITLKKNEDVLRANPEIDKLYLIKQNLFAIPKLFPLRLKKEIDLIIDLNDNDSKTSTFLLKFFKANHKLGFNFPSQRKYLTNVIDQPDKEKTHLVERYAYLLKSSGLSIPEEITKPILYLDSAIEKKVKEELNSAKENFKLIGINISAGASIRKYPAQKWKELIESLNKKFKSIKFLILNDQSDKKDLPIITENFDQSLFINISGNTFQHFAAKIKLCDLVITPDTSAVHICSAFQIPVIALYPNVKWNFISFAPYKTPNRSILSQTEEIKNISIEQIVIAFEELTNELGYTL